jgi:hypothetical protein
MWMLTFIPDSILHAFVNIVFYSGVVGTLLGFIFNFPTLRQYRLIIQVVSILLLVAGVYFKGGYEVEIQWRERVAEMQAKVDAAEEKSKVVNTVIKTKVVTKFKTIHDTKIVTQEVIKEVAAKIDTECKVAPEALIILNSAAQNKVPLNLTIPKEELK